MRSKSHDENRDLTGTIEVRELSPNEFPDCYRQPSIRNVARYVWRPPKAILSAEFSKFTLALDCFTSVDGIRRFSCVALPSGSPLFTSAYRFILDTTGLTLVASVGGARLLEAQSVASISRFMNFDQARLLIQYAWHLQEWLGETVDYSQMLKICAAARSDPTARSILPCDLGTDHSMCRPWGEERIKSEGLKAAKIAGVRAPTDEQILRYGLVEAAKVDLCGWKLESEESQAITRLCLFAFGNVSEKLNNAQTQFVAGRTLKALSKRLNDTDDAFRNWLDDRKSNLPKFIARPKDSPVNRKQARLGLLELGWHALQVVGQCVDAQMRAFRDSFSDPLSEYENSVFEFTYLSNPAFGGLPLILLHERLRFLNEAVLAVWRNPGDVDAMAVVHKLMYYYSVLSGNRREADRLYKRRRKI